MVNTLKVGDQTKKEMSDFYKDFKREKTPQYALFQADVGDTVVTLYESGKVVFQGKDADVDYNLWLQRNSKLHPEIKQKEKEKEKKEDKTPTRRYDGDTVGSDEVGTGDFFGPIVVSSAYVKKDDVEFLEDLGVKDSKKLTDDIILDIAPKIMKQIAYETIVLSNEEYNKNYSKDVNMNKIKAILHNKVLILISKKVDKCEFVVVDQFTTPKSYFFYLKDSKNVFRNITFLTKAESFSLSVACASIISRYFFIKKMDELSAKYKTSIPYGAGEKADIAASLIVKEYGFEELKKTIKMNFKNIEKVKLLTEKE